MATTVHNLNVQPGMEREYFYTFNPAASGDVLKLLFDKEFTLGNLIMSAVNTITSNAALVYPISQLSLVHPFLGGYSY